MIWLFHQTTEWFVSSSCLFVTHFLLPKNKGRRQKSTAAARRGRSGNGRAPVCNGRCQKAKAISKKPVAADTWPMRTWFFFRIFPQQVFNLESIVGIWYESQCFFEQFGRSKDFSHQKNSFRNNLLSICHSGFEKAHQATGLSWATLTAAVE